MKNRLKRTIKDWRVILLLVFLVFSLITIQPQLFGTDGVIIRNVDQNSSAALAGMQSPDATAQPLNKPRILSVAREPVNSEQEFYSAVDLLLPNQTVQIETSEQVYTLVVGQGDSVEKLGIKVSDVPSSNLRKGLDLEGGTRVLLQPAEAVSEEDLDLIITNLQQRLNVYGLSDIVVREASDLAGKQFILVEIAGVTEEEVQELLASQGKFEATIGNETVFKGGDEDITYVCRTAQCSGIDPSIGCYQTGEGYGCGFFFSITLSPDAAETHARVTEKLDVVTDNGHEYLSEDLHLFLDDTEVDTLRVGASLRGRATTQIQISGSGVGRTQAEAQQNTLDNMKRLQTIMITGSLPVKLEVVKMDTISPTLGNEFLSNIFLVGLLVISSVIVVVFARYRTLKIVVPMVLTMLAELLLILGFAAFVGWNLDLAAIAGIIIVAGTGVDHLIVITDENLKGKVTSNWKRAIKNAMFIVMGAYMTTVSGMLPLLWAGAGLLKGFALTTIAGISFGVFIARPAYARVLEYLLDE